MTGGQDPDLTRGACPRSSTGAVVLRSCARAGEVPLTRRRPAAAPIPSPGRSQRPRRSVRDVGDLVARRYLTVADGLSLIRDAARADVP